MSTLPNRFYRWDDHEAAAQYMAGNWQRFQSFCWHDQPEDAPSSWCLTYTGSRDDGLLDQSNVAAIEAILAPFLEEDTDDPDIIPQRHSHWACGWVEGYAIRVYKAGEITAVFRAWCEIQARLSNYPVLDEEDYSRREYEATLENIEEAGRGMVREDAPEDWPSQVFSWFWENDQGAVENSDDRGGYPSDEEMRNALEALGFLDSDEEDLPDTSGDTHWGGCTPTRSR